MKRSTDSKGPRPKAKASKWGMGSEGQTQTEDSGGRLAASPRGSSASGAQISNVAVATEKPRGHALGKRDRTVTALVRAS